GGGGGTGGPAGCAPASRCQSDARDEPDDGREEGEAASEAQHWSAMISVFRETGSTGAGQGRTLLLPSCEIACILFSKSRIGSTAVSDAGPRSLRGILAMPYRCQSPMMT